MDDRHQLTERNRLAIERARRAGVHFVLASGRGPQSVSYLQDDLGIRNQSGEYMIAYNGGMICENKGNRPLYRNGLTYEKARALYERGLAYDVGLRVYTTEACFLHYTRYHVEKDTLLGNQNNITVTDTTGAFLKGREVIKCLYDRSDYAYLFKVRDAVADLTEDLTVTYSSGRYLEFNPRGVDKGSGLRFLASHLGIPMEETLAIGDNYNDLPMLRAAGLGVCVANGLAAVKAEADVITASDNNNSAVAEVLDNYVL